MIISISKSKEIVFRRPNSQLEMHIMSLPGIDLNLLGVAITDNRFRFESRVTFIFEMCSQHSYILRRFRDQDITNRQFVILKQSYHHE